MSSSQGTQAEVPQNLRTGISWQEIIAVLFGIVGGLIYFIATKQPKNKKVFVFVLASVLNFIGMLIPSPQPTAVSQPDAQSSSFAKPNYDPEKKAQALLDEISQKYNFSRFIDTWGMGTQGLFLPEEAWVNLSPDQQQILIKYAEYKKLKGIVVGRSLGNNNISLDRTVWGE